MHLMHNLYCWRQGGRDFVKGTRFCQGGRDFVKIGCRPLCSPLNEALTVCGVTINSENYWLLL